VATTHFLGPFRLDGAAQILFRGAETPLFSDATLTHTRGAHVFKFGFYFERWKAVKANPAIGPARSISARTPTIQMIPVIPMRTLC